MKFLTLHKQIISGRKYRFVFNGYNYFEPKLWNGLCFCPVGKTKLLMDDETFQLFSVGMEDFKYWAAEGDFFDTGTLYTPLRQTIILLCAAINNEL